MSRFRNRHATSIAPTPGTILPGVPLVDRDLGHLIPQQRVHDPLSAADRSDVHGATMLVDEPMHSVAEPAMSGSEQIGDVADVVEVRDAPGTPEAPEIPETPEALEENASITSIEDQCLADEFDPSQAIDDELLEAVVRRRPRAVHPTSAAMVRPPAPERVKLMVGVLARDFERLGTPAPPKVGTRVEGRPPPALLAPAVEAAPVWGPWAEPHTASWPVIVPPWGALPRSFGSPLPELVTHSA